MEKMKKRLSEEHKRKIGIANKGKIPWIKGRHHTEETRKKISNALKGKVFTEERRKKISNAMKGKISWNKGKKLSPITIEKIKEALRNNPPNLLKRRLRKFHILKQKYHMHPKWLFWYWYFYQRKSLYQCSKILGFSPTNFKWLFKQFGFTPRDLRESHLGVKQSKWTKLKRSHALRGKKRSAQAIKNVMRRRIPTSLEIKFQRIVDKYGLPYKYVGDGSFILENCNPDFINTNGKKIAVEVFARYYKSRGGRSIEEWKEKRSKIFGKYGWKVAYFDETQITDKIVLKTLQFLGGNCD